MDEKIIVKRNIKDSVFAHLFQDKRYVLRLFQALHPEAHGVTEDMIELVTLENVLVDDIYNDLGFMVGEQLIVLVEAQSTWTVNIIVRVLLYLAKTYHDYIDKRDLNLYGNKKIALPQPELYVIYVGDKEIQQDVISLSEEFFDGKKTDLDIRVHVLTDSEQGDIINQYITFTRILNEKVRLYGRTRQAILETIQICKDRDVLAEYLAQHETEVRNIMISLFDNNQILRAFTKEKLEEGRAEGEARGLAKGRAEGRAEGRAAVAQNMLRMGMPDSTIAEASGLSISEINSLKTQVNHQSIGL